MLTGCKGTAAYAAPEVLDEAQAYDTGADVWSAGVVAYTLLAGGAPSGARRWRSSQGRCATGTPPSAAPPREGVSPGAKAFVDLLLTKSPISGPRPCRLSVSGLPTHIQYSSRLPILQPTTIPTCNYPHLPLSPPTTFPPTTLFTYHFFTYNCSHLPLPPPTTSPTYRSFHLVPACALVGDTPRHPCSILASRCSYTLPGVPPGHPFLIMACPVLLIPLLP